MNTSHDGLPASMDHPHPGYNNLDLEPVHAQTVAALPGHSEGRARGRASGRLKTEYRIFN
jgi:hypothetical protein